MTPEQLAKTKSEHSEQVALFAWANMAERFGSKLADIDKSYLVAGYAEEVFSSYAKDDNLIPIPELQYLFAIHNQGHGDVVRGAKAKAEGVKRGVPDLMLPVTQKLECNLGETQPYGWHGLFIEMKKVKGGVTSNDQLRWHEYLCNAGYKVVVCKGWIEGRNAILEYLGK